MAPDVLQAGLSAKSDVMGLNGHTEVASGERDHPTSAGPSRDAPCWRESRKPMPMPSPGDTICELMPTSSPFMLTSAPPELP